MPDVIILHAPNPTSTATSVWRLGHDYPTSLRSGVFTVRGNGGSFLAHALAGRRLRFDPVSMSPADQLAKEAKSFFELARDRAHTHRWDTGEALLFVDNRTALHGRDAVHDPDDAKARVLKRAAYYLESA